MDNEDVIRATMPRKEEPMVIRPVARGPNGEMVGDHQQATDTCYVDSLSQITLESRGEEADAKMSSFLESIGGRRVDMSKMHHTGPIVVQPMVPPERLEEMHRNLLGLHHQLSFHMRNSWGPKVEEGAPVTMRPHLEAYDELKNQAMVGRVLQLPVSGHEPFPTPGDE